MNLKKLTIVPMLAMALFAVGCGDDCVSACEDAKECDGATAAMKDRDCDKDCEDGAKEAEDAGCEDQYDDYAGCIADLDDVCKFNPEEDCTSEATALAKCATE